MDGVCFVSFCGLGWKFTPLIIASHAMNFIRRKPSAARSRLAVLRGYQNENMGRVIGVFLVGSPFAFCPLPLIDIALHCIAFASNRPLYVSTDQT